MTSSDIGIENFDGFAPDIQTVICAAWVHLNQMWRDAVSSECLVGEEHWAVEHALQGLVLAEVALNEAVQNAARRIADGIGGHYQQRVHYWLRKFHI